MRTLAGRRGILSVITKRNREYDADPQRARANAPGQVEPVRESTLAARARAQCPGCRPTFVPYVTNVNVQN